MHEDIGQFEVPVHNLVLDDGLEGVENLDKKLDGLFFGDGFVLLEVLLKIALVAVLEDEIEIIGSFLYIVQPDDVFIIASPEHLDLVLQQLQKLPCIGPFLPFMFSRLMALMAISVLSTLLYPL